jgi:hypothetical protein
MVCAATVLKVGRHEYVLFDPLFDEGGADAIVRLCERFGSYGMYSQENVDSEIGRGLSQRHDSVLNFLRTGGRLGRPEPVATLVARTNYFREEYAYGQRALIEGIEPFLNHEAFVDGARHVHGRPVIEPAIVFANLMVPGQELALHTDVPEFRGCNRKVMPQWLLVAMHHSGLFEEWRMPIATGVAWFHDCKGGEFAFYPDGAAAPAVAHEVRYNTAILLDADSVFHGVDRIADTHDDMPPLKPGMQLVFEGGGKWAVRDGDRCVVRYDWEELRFSVSWKAYCFADAEEQSAWRDHASDLTLDHVVARLVDDLRARGRIDGEVPGNPDLGLMIIDEYIRFPVA